MISFYRDPGNVPVTRRHFGRYQVANPPLVSNASASTDESWTAKSAHVILPEEPSDPPALWNTLELFKWKVGRFSLIYIEFNLTFNLIFNLLSETGFYVHFSWWNECAAFHIRRRQIYDPATEADHLAWYGKFLAEKYGRHQASFF